MKERIHAKFAGLYGEGGIFYAAAGRINLIGEHTDYNGGYVFPGAIDKGIMAAIKLNGTSKVRAFSLDYNEACAITVIIRTPSSWNSHCWRRFG